MHGTYRQVAETSFGIEMLGRHLHGARTLGAPVTTTPPERARAELTVTWYLDRPVANSGRLRALLLEIAERRGWPWSCELVNNPDAVLINHPAVATSDAWILDHPVRWFDPLASLLAVGSDPRGPFDPESALAPTGPVLPARPGLWLLDLG